MKKNEQQTAPTTMEGRLTSKDGKDLGDRLFHERDMNMRPEDELKHLKDMTEMEVVRREELAAELEPLSPDASRELYRRLSDENPEHPHREAWLKKTSG